MDPIFDLPAPLVFAHRGGAGEVPESTELAFRHAIEVGAHALELDLQLTRDGRIVVWHGPELDNVYLGGRILRGKSIREMDWSEIATAQVVHPRHPRDRREDPRRRLLLLGDFIRVVGDIEREREVSGNMPWNIELKEPGAAWEQAFPALFEHLNEQAKQRKILLATLREEDAARLREAISKHAPKPSPYAVNVAMEEQLAHRRWMRLGLWQSFIADFAAWYLSVKPGASFQGRALQTSHALAGARLVNKVHDEGGAVHVFLTQFPLVSRGVDHQKSEVRLMRELTRLMAIGVDGIMTDYPARVAPLVERLRRERNEAGALHPGPEERGAAWFGAATVIVALVLLLLGSMLHVRGGWGIEDFLAFARAEVNDRPFGSWVDSGRLPFAWAYLLADSLVFVPVYAAFGASFIAALRKTASIGASSRVWHVLRVPVWALVVLDLIENGFGLARISPVGGGGVMLVGSALALLILQRLWSLLDRMGERRSGALTAVAAAIAIVATAAGALDGACAGPSLIAQVGCGAHRAKPWLVGISTASLGLAGFAWLFDVRRFLSRDHTGNSAASAIARRLLRSAIGDVLMRSRYVLLALVFVGVLIAAMDQGRDVLYAMAASPFQLELAEAGLLPWIGSIFSMTMLVAATAWLEYSCWLWTRSVCQLAPPSSAPREDMAKASGAAPFVNAFARYWARAVAFIPIVFLAALHARVIQDGVMSAPEGSSIALYPVHTVFVFGLVLIAVGTRLLQRHADSPDSDPTRYYSSLSWSEWCAVIGFWGDRDTAVKYRFFFRRLRVYWLPCLLALGIVVCRLIDVAPATWPWNGDYVPSMALSVVLFSVALWLCFFGWLSLLEVHQSIPWVGSLIVFVAALGGFGLTDNHIVWSAVESAPITGEAAVRAAATAGVRMLLFTFLLLALLLGLYGVAINIARRRTRRDELAVKPARRLWATAGILALSMLPLLCWADSAATSRALATGGVRSAGERPALNAALGAWLMGLCQPSADEKIVCDAEDESIPVYFVSAEGGGIRAAAWTAFALEQLAKDPQFLARTFSISGVSGGAVGAAAFRACSVQEHQPDGKTRAQCLRDFAATDMLSPLLSAWLFEDLLGRVVPTSWCDTPACGVLSRGAWFEQALENGARALRQGLIETRGESGGMHVPYLLLNATWVESGERAIASDLVIDWKRFPDAKDQLAITGRDLPLGTAAHNAARFPYINAIGSLHAPQDLCAKWTLPPTPSDGDARSPAQMNEDESTAPAIQGCGHLADGGYFDNSGGQTTLDVLRGFEACLADPPPEEPCGGLSDAQRRWLRAHLVPQVLMIRNDVDTSLACAEACPLRHEEQSPLADPAPSCPKASDSAYHPDRPTCNAARPLFVGLAGPAVTLLNVSGIRAHGQLAEARQGDAVRELRRRMGGAAAACDQPGLATIDLLPDGVLYPLGWHLSPLAIEGMWKRAEVYAPAGENHCQHSIAAAAQLPGKEQQ